jgi:hypothetical protein
VTLTWSATAEQVAIYRLDPLGRLTMPAYEVPLSGTLVVTTSETLHNSVNFVLFAISPAGTAQAGAYATILCLDTWFFAKPPSDCPVGPPKWTQLIVQDFEHGQMLWAEVSRMIYILYTGGTRWEIRPDTWVEGMSEDDPAIMPPAGFFQPVRGFGLVWRDEQTPAGARVRDRLGWAGMKSIRWDRARCSAIQPRIYHLLRQWAGCIVYELKPEGSGWSVWAAPNPGVSLVVKLPVKRETGRENDQPCDCVVSGTIACGISQGS